MKKSRAYRSVNVKNVDLEPLLKACAGQAVHVGLDISKEDVMAVVRWESGDFERPWKVDNPGQLSLLIGLLSRLKEGRKLVVALEPTGTYGDPLRQALSDAGLAAHRVSPKAAHDYAEVFDGAPSQHDGKDAAVIAELAALGKSSPWPFVVDDWERELAYWVERQDVRRRQLTMCQGRLEGLLARHWPEATRELGLSSGVLLRALAHYGGPAELAADEDAMKNLIRWGRGKIPQEKAQVLIDMARSSMGVRMSPIDQRRMRDFAEEAVGYRRELARITRELKRLASGHEVIEAQAAAVGVVTACVLWVHLGDPRNYDSAAAYRKAMGLNLTERSSGKWKGQLKISKRGSSQVRRWLYFAAMRLVCNEGVKPWYQEKQRRRPNDRVERMRALVGVMRRLSLALYWVATEGREFDASRLFPEALAAEQSRSKKSAPATDPRAA